MSRLSPLASFVRVLPLVLAACVGSVGCTAELDGDDHDHGDDIEEGDTSTESALTPGYGVPASLGLNKNRKLYLTFDDGPSAAYTNKILDTLKAHRAPATFFVTGKNIAGQETVLRREATEGHIVASHQWEHVKATETQLRSWAPKERDLLDQIAGRQPHYFRYPYGAGTAAKEAILKQSGYVDGGIGWDIDTLDWCFSKTGTCNRDEVKAAYRSDFVGWVVSECKRRGGGVVLFHDVQGITQRNLDAIMTELEAEGFEFANLPSTGR
jgi:peptidoglycan-N-acetylglucosamine deacetylase